MSRANSSEHLRYRYGICLNDQCSKCKTKEVQTILARKDFVCEECGKQLRECPPPVSFWGKHGKKIIIAGVVVAVAAIVGVAVALSGNKKEEPTKPEPVAANDTIILNRETTTLKVGDIDTVKVTNLPADTKLTFKASTGGEVSVDANGVVTAVKAGVGKVRVALASDDNVKAYCVYNVEEKGQEAEPTTEEPTAEPKPTGTPKEKPTSTTSGPKVSWGRYSGPDNGLGGTIYVTKSYSLSLNNTSGETLELSPGDEIQQTKFQNGQLRQGVWIHSGSRRFFTR